MQGPLLSEAPLSVTHNNILRTIELRGGVKHTQEGSEPWSDRLRFLHHHTATLEHIGMGAVTVPTRKKTFSSRRRVSNITGASGPPCEDCSFRNGYLGSGRLLFSLARKAQDGTLSTASEFDDSDVVFITEARPTVGVGHCNRISRLLSTVLLV